ncbi:hypothetical protein TNCV_1424981 [Trichonephila clavipes]|nr:hypothetical protein TNCV_1424981 [Trichonephila clavipes]
MFSKAVCTPSHDKTSCIFSVDQEPVRRSFTWSCFTASMEFSKKRRASRIQSGLNGVVRFHMQLRWPSDLSHLPRKTRTQ